MRDDAPGPRGWRLLERLLPRWYARRYGTELWRTHVAERQPGTARVGFWLRLVCDVVLTSLQLRIDALFERTSSPRARRGGGGDIMIQQIRYVLRSLRRAPGFVLTVVLTLGLGIGATVTLFTILDRLYFSAPEHVVAAEQVHRLHVYGRNVFSQQVQYSASLSYPDFVDLEGVHGFTAVAAFAEQDLAADAGGARERVRAELVSASYWQLLGVRAQVGRFFTAAEDRIEGGAAVAVLGYGYWQRAFGGDAGVLGRELRLGKGVYTVIGVAPRGFTGVGITPVAVWVPLRSAGALQNGTGWRDARRWWWLRGVARLEPEQRDAVAAAATAAYRAGRAPVAGQDPNARVVLTPLIEARGPLGSREAQVAQLLGGLALLVLLIACANVANLLLARGVQRRRLLAIQTAIGVTRGRLLAQVLAESVVLALAAGAVALGFTRLIAPLLFRVLLPDAVLASGGAVRLVGFTSAVALAVSVLIGLVPALRSTRFEVLEALRSARESRRGPAFRRALLFVQAALSAVLVIGAGLFVRSLQRAHAVDLGTDVSALAVEFELHDGTRSGEEISELSYVVAERLRALPFVRHAAVTQLPHFSGVNGLTILAAGDTVANGPRGPFFYSAGAGYFDAVGLRILRGRPLAATDDRAGAEPVAVVSESFGAALPARDPLGECLYVEPDRDTLPGCTRIVGVVEDVWRSLHADAPLLNVYLPPHHPGIGFTAAGIVMVATKGAPPLAELRAAAASASPRIGLVEVNSLASFLDYELRPWRLGAVLLTAFGVLALLVAAAGLYSVLSFDVAQRRFELGVRAALGAGRRRLVRAVALRSLVICAAGAITGVVATMVLSRYAATLLFRGAAIELGVYIGAVALLALCALGAAALPAWRAVRIDPRTALRAD